MSNRSNDCQPRRGGAHFASNGKPDATGPQPMVSAIPSSSLGNPYADAGAPGGRGGRGGKGGKPKRTASRIVSNILLIVGLALLLAAGGMWGLAQWRYHQQDVENEKLAQYAQVSEDGSTAPQVNWDELKKLNADVVGWIQIPGTVINYPVYQGKDNDYYLNTNAEGTYGVGGQIFLDYENAKPGMQNQQTLVYGHHLKNGAMFKQVADMDNQQFFDSVGTIWYVTEDKTYELEPLFLYYTNPEDTTVRQFDFASGDEFHAYLDGKLQNAVTQRQDAKKIADGSSHVLTLSTCNYVDGYGRTILVCVEKSEAKAAVGQGN